MRQLCCQEHKSNSCQRGEQTSVEDVRQSRYSHVFNVCPWTGHHTCASFIRRGILPVIDQCSPLDCGARTMRHMFWSIDAVLLPGSSQRGSPSAALPHLCAFKKYHNAKIAYDPTDPLIDEAAFEAKDWTLRKFGHIDRKEALPDNKVPEPRGQGFTIKAKVDASLGSDSISRRSRTGFFVLINCALIHWLSK